MAADLLAYAPPAIDNSMPETRFAYLSDTSEVLFIHDTPLLSHEQLVTKAQVNTPSINGRLKDALVALAISALQLTGVALVPTSISEVVPIRTHSRPSTARSAKVEPTADGAAAGREPSDPTGSPANRTLQAVEDLKGWLALADYEVAELCGFARRNLANWKAGRGSYGVATRGLLSTHALVSELVRVLGLPGANVWLETPIQAGPTALARLKAGQLEIVVNAAAPVLFPSVKMDEAERGLWESPTYFDDTVTSLVEAPGRQLPRREPRRPRRVPPRA